MSRLAGVSDRPATVLISVGVFLGPLVLVLVTQFAGLAFGDLVRGEQVTAQSSLSIGSDPSKNGSADALRRDYAAEGVTKSTRQPK